MKTAQWIKVATQSDFEEDLGACVKVGDTQIAIFNTHGKTQWYAVENRCPHEHQYVLARGIVGDRQGEPKVACPLHKRAFSLKTGQCLNDNLSALRVFDIKCENQDIYIQLTCEDDACDG